MEESRHHSTPAEELFMCFGVELYMYKIQQSLNIFENIFFFFFSLTNLLENWTNSYRCLTSMVMIFFWTVGRSIQTQTDSKADPHGAVWTLHLQWVSHHGFQLLMNDKIIKTSITFSFNLCLALHEWLSAFMSWHHRVICNYYIQAHSYLYTWKRVDGSSVYPHTQISPLNVWADTYQLSPSLSSWSRDSPSLAETLLNGC